MFSKHFVRVSNPRLTYLHCLVLNKIQLFVGVEFQKIYLSMKHSRKDKLLSLLETQHWLRSHLQRNQVT